MKFMICFTSSILIAFILISIFPSAEESKIYSDLIRLHVIAASDNEEDQELKLKVRDSILKTFGENLNTVTELDKAEEYLKSSLENIKTEAEKTILNEGFDYTVNVFLDTERYPKREYESFSLPAGEYLSLRIVIGEGNGKNWWCVIFPPLCTSVASKKEDVREYISVGLTPSEYNLIKNDDKPVYKIKFKIFEIFSSIFSD